MGPVTPAFARFTRPPVMVESGDPWTPRLVKEDVGTRAIPAELATILAAHFLTVCENGAALAVENFSGQGIHSFLAHLTSGVDAVPFLEQVTVVRFERDRRVHHIKLLLSVRVNLYFTRQCMFACLGELPAMPPPSPRWWISPTRPLRRGNPFVPCREWTMSPTLGGSTLPIGR